MAELKVKSKKLMYEPKISSNIKHQDFAWTCIKKSLTISLLVDFINKKKILNFNFISMPDIPYVT